MEKYRYKDREIKSDQIYPEHIAEETVTSSFQNSQSCICIYRQQNTNINTFAHLKKSQFHMCTYPLQYHKHKHKGSLKKRPVLQVIIPVTTTKREQKGSFPKFLV